MGPRLPHQVMPPEVRQPSANPPTQPAIECPMCRGGVGGVFGAGRAGRSAAGLLRRSLGPAYPDWPPNVGRTSTNGPGGRPDHTTSAHHAPFRSKSTFACPFSKRREMFGRETRWALPIANPPAPRSAPSLDHLGRRGRARHIVLVASGVIGRVCGSKSHSRTCEAKPSHCLVHHPGPHFYVVGNV